MLTTAGQILINDELPEKYRDYGRTLDKKAVGAMLARIAAEDPDAYKKINHMLYKKGADFAYTEGASFSLKDFKLPPKVKAAQDAMRKHVWSIVERDELTDEQKQDGIADYLLKEKPGLEKLLMKETLASGNRLALQAASGSRGKPADLMSIMVGDLVLADHRDQIVPVPAMTGYAAGLDPAEFWGGSYGARKGSICLAEGTRVLLWDYSSKAIKDVLPGDIVMGANPDGSYSPTAVTALHNNGLQPVYDYDFRKGATRGYVSVRCTENHKFLAINKLLNAKVDTYSSPSMLPLSDAKYLLKNKKRTNHMYKLVALGELVDDSAYLNEPRAMWLGAMLGDGCTAASTHGSMSYSCADAEYMRVLRSELEPLGLTFTKVQSSDYGYVLACTHNKGKPIHKSGKARAFDNEHKAWMWRLLGNTLAPDKRIPAEVFTWDNASCAAVISGLVMTDGSVTGDGSGKRGWVSFASTSKALVEDFVRLLELRFGIWCTGLNCTAYEYRRHMWGVSIAHPESLRRFRQHIKLYSYKADRLANLSLAHTEKTPTYGHRIQNRTYVGLAQTYDISIDTPLHAFVLANGIITSNSTKLATGKTGFLGKLLAQASHRLVVTENDCGTARGLPINGDDPDIVGNVLAMDKGEYKAGTVITPRAAEDLRGQDIVVRAATTCGSDHGICAKCAGVREFGRLPEIGENVGVTAAMSISENLSQGALGAKHCLAAGTLVRMADWSTKCIEDIVVGDMVLAGGKADRRTFPAKVVNTYDNGTRECIRTSFRYAGGGGPRKGEAAKIELVSTPEHKVLWDCVELGTWPNRYSSVAIEPIKAHHHKQNARVFLPVVSRCTAVRRLCKLLPLRGCKRALVSDWLATAPGYRDGLNGTRYKYSGTELLGELPTYDIEIATDDHLFVLANGMLVSNSGGRATGEEGTVRGFELVNQLVSVPKVFKEGAAVSNVDGYVSSIEPAPQGGVNITVGSDIVHYPNADMVTVKQGDFVEAGDVLSRGIVNPANIVKHKGIGEGRRAFVKQVVKAYRDSNMTVNRRNVEALARGLINHVAVTDMDGVEGAFPGDTIEYDTLERTYKPRADALDLDTKAAAGQYLESPALHYTIGTRLTKTMIDELNNHGIMSVNVNKRPPPFEPVMVRALETLSKSPDWQVRMGGSYLKKSITEGVQRGRSSDMSNISYMPSLARGVGFGDKLDETGRY